MLLLLLETHLMWTLKAWAAWGVSRSWAGRQGGWVAGLHLAAGEDARRRGGPRYAKGSSRRVA